MPDHHKHAFIYSGGAMTDLNSLIDAGSGWYLYRAADINNNGQISGTGMYNGQYRAFLLTPDAPPPPVPEPETYAMLLAGLGLLGVIGRRRKWVGGQKV